MPIQGLRFSIPSGAEFHRSFQATGSFTAYNPNDGVALIALDRTATLLDYDHKLPSQSGGHFPGPINSYLSIRYQDQSGAGTSGEVIVYGTSDILQVPRFWSIGRAVQSQVTAMDIVQGVQPGNPPSGVDRLWADSSGNIHHLHSNGADFTLVDPSNALSLLSPIFDARYFQTSTVLGGGLTGTLPNPGLNTTSVQNAAAGTALGGDLAGTVAVGTIFMRNNSYALAHDTGGIQRNYFGVMNDGNTYLYNVGGANIRFLSQDGSTELAHFDNVGNQTILGTFTADLNISANGGRLFLPDSNHSIFSTSNNTYYDEYGGGWNWRNSLSSFQTRLRLDGLGNLHIDSSGGDPTPKAQLDLYGLGAASWPGYANTAQNVISTLGGVVWIRDSSGGAGNGGTLLLGAAGGVQAGIKLFFTDGASNGTGDLSFAVRRVNSDTSLTESMRIYRGGDIAFGGGAPAVGVGQGFPMIPRMGGAPTALIDGHGNGWAHMVYDGGNHRLWLWDVGTWRYVTLT
jgi:hypothetical protein